MNSLSNIVLRGEIPPVSCFEPMRKGRGSLSVSILSMAAPLDFQSPPPVHRDPSPCTKSGKNEVLASAFLERFLTDPDPVLFTTGTGNLKRRSNDLVLACSTNFGSLSVDLHNRSLPIHLQSIGDVASRTSAIGNPKLEYLPRNQGRIEAEFRGMVDRRAGRINCDTSARTNNGRSESRSVPVTKTRPRLKRKNWRPGYYWASAPRPRVSVRLAAPICPGTNSAS